LRPALERTGLFARVTLLDTTREAFLDSEAIAFKLECSLDAPAAGPGNATGGAPTASGNRGAAPGGRGPRQAVTSSTAGDRQ
jgi:hypothetical protein